MTSPPSYSGLVRVYCMFIFKCVNTVAHIKWMNLDFKSHNISVSCEACSRLIWGSATVLWAQFCCSVTVYPRNWCSIVQWCTDNWVFLLQSLFSFYALFMYGSCLTEAPAPDILRRDVYAWPFFSTQNKLKSVIDPKRAVMNFVDFRFLSTSNIFLLSL
jgi:hypothetical protein